MPLVAPPLEHYRRLKILHDKFRNQLWCLSSASLGLHIWRRHDPVPSEPLHAKITETLERVGLRGLEIYPLGNQCQRLPCGRDYIVITATGHLARWQDQVQYYGEEWESETPEFPHIVLTMLDIAMRNYNRAIDWGSGLTIKSGRELNTFLTRQREVMAWLDRGCRDLAINIPVVPEMPSNLRSADSPEGNLSDKASRWRGKRMPPPQKAAASDLIWEEDIPKSLPSGNIPDHRNTRWPFWCEYAAQHGLYEKGSLAMVCRELATWFLWIEWFDRPDKVERTAESLLDFIRAKHNDCISRGADHPELPGQIQRCVKTAMKQTPESKEQFAICRQKRAQGKYRRLIVIGPIIMGACAASPVATATSIPLDYKCDLKDSCLPAEMESQLTHLALAERMRQRGGVYPLLRFARPFLSALWASQGKARINRETCLVMSASKKPHLQSRYKKLLVRAGLLRPDWEWSIRRHHAAALYRLTDAAMALFQAENQLATGS
jgi:hypothetical protein